MHTSGIQPEDSHIHCLASPTTPMEDDNNGEYIWLFKCGLNADTDGFIAVWSALVLS